MNLTKIKSKVVPYVCLDKLLLKAKDPRIEGPAKDHIQWLVMQEIYANGGVS